MVTIGSRLPPKNLPEFIASTIAWMARLWAGVPTRIMETNRRHYLTYLDSLRGLAALVVAAFWHYQHLTGSFQPGGAPFEASPLYNIEPFHTFYSKGYLCVDLFYMISGLIFGHVYLREIDEKRISGGRFFLLRFARLYPIHILTLLITGGLIWIFHAQTGRFPVYPTNGAMQFAANLLFLQYTPWLITDHSFNGPSWSLSIEAWMYALFWIVAARRLTRFGAPLLVAFGAISWLYGLDQELARGIVGFFGGVLIQRLCGRGLLVQALFPALACGFLALLHFDLFPDIAPINASFAAAWAASAITLVIAQNWTLLQRVLEVGILRLLGDLSLAIYLIHFPVQVAVLSTFVALNTVVPSTSWMFWGSLTGLELLGAWTIHVAFERPSRRWLRSRIARWAAAPIDTNLRPKVVLQQPSG